MAEAPSNPRSHNWGMVECGADPVPNEAMQVIEEGSRVGSLGDVGETERHCVTGYHSAVYKARAGEGRQRKCAN